MQGRRVAAAVAFVAMLSGGLLSAEPPMTRDRPSDVGMHQTQDPGKGGAKYPQLGEKIVIDEIGKYSGVWTRIPGTDTFKASWNGGAINDVIEIRSIESGKVTLFRRGNGGFYYGTLKGDGTISGTASWYQPGWEWKGVIEGALPLPIPAPPAPNEPAKEVRILGPTRVAYTDLFQVRVLVPPELSPKVVQYYFSGNGAAVSEGEIEPYPFSLSLSPVTTLQFVGAAPGGELDFGVRLLGKTGDVGSASARITVEPVRLVGQAQAGWVIMDMKDRNFHAKLPRSSFGPEENHPGLLEGECNVSFHDARVTSMLGLRRLVERELGLKEDAPSLRQFSVAGFAGYALVEEPEIQYLPSGFVDLNGVGLKGARIRAILMKGRALISVNGSINCSGGRWGTPGRYSRDDTSEVKSRGNSAFAQMMAIVGSVSLQRGQ